MNLVGYANRLSVPRGSTIQFMVSTELGRYDVDVVRLVQGDNRPEGPGFSEEVVPTEVSGTLPGRIQRINPGSYARVLDSPLLGLADGLTIQAWVYPTTPKKGVQGLLTKGNYPSGPGYGLVLDEEGGLALWLAGSEGSIYARTGRSIHSNQWHFIACTYDSADGNVYLFQELIAPPWRLHDRLVSMRTSLEPRQLGRNQTPLLIGALHTEDDEEGPIVVGHFNGRIEAPRIYGRALSEGELKTLKEDGTVDGAVASWDFSVSPASTRIDDTSENELHGELINMPMRAVRGHNWDGTETVYRLAQGQYGAVHFHADDLQDAGWEVDFELKLPDDFKSGAYAARLRSGNYEEYIPFFVRPKLGEPTAKIGILFPTLTYIAYANERYYEFEAQDWNRTSEHRLELQPHDLYIENHPELGLSVYDMHEDGSGTACYSSRLRPILNMRPKQIQYWTRSARHFVADLYLVSWLEHFGYPYDVLTDEDLNHEGNALLEPYSVILLCQHAEYWTSRMREGLSQYVNRGGVS
jgi:N,N-dimethylformamidase